MVGKLLLFILGVGWTAIFYLGKRTLASIDKKIDGNIAAIERSQQVLRSAIKKQNRLNATKSEKRIAEREKACRRFFVSRQEFGAFTATINHKIDSIYEILKKEGTPAK